MATIADVARQAGVAPSTVSHALSGKRPIAAATRERIITAARELGYEPNATAGTVRVRRARTVGLSLPLDSPGRTLSHGPFAEYVADIADLLAAPLLPQSLTDGDPHSPPACRPESPAEVFYGYE